MRTTSYLLSTLKETPAEAVLASHRLMLRAGLIRQIGQGLYTWLPLGLRVLSKATAIIREEMDKAGALEMIMPIVQPADLWRESGRYVQYGPELCRFKDRKKNEYVLGPTHEEVITSIARREIKSARQLPVNLYQFQWKFRDEIRPRFGVMRSREFLMKDGYSFDTDVEGLGKSYQAMYDAYSRAFTRMGLNFRPVQADTGSIGGYKSHEFQVLADAGEDLIAYSDGSDYAANIEKAECLVPQGEREAAKDAYSEVPTPGAHTVDEACQAVGVATKKMLKSLVIHGRKLEDGSNELVMICLCGNQELNEIKASKIEGIANPIEFASDEEIQKFTGAHPGSLGPVGFKGRILVDRDADRMGNFACGANRDGYHLINVNWDRDVPKYEVFDLRNVEEGDLSPDGHGKLHLCRGIEVGHVFMLGTKYSEAMHCTVTDENGKEVPMIMGCYGIGVTRVIAAAIEQSHDDRGIIWNEALAPFKVAIVSVRADKSEAVRNTAEELYQKLTAAGIEVLYDDRDERPGFKFADMDLIGIPHIVTIGDKGLSQGVIEYKDRRSGERENLPLDHMFDALCAKFAKNN
ncbi:MAG: proline--tRNA ligase [Succinatimonas sp.]|nr:proline--tRNA ligase [Succinatimonas sp.]